MAVPRTVRGSRRERLATLSKRKKKKTTTATSTTTTAALTNNVKHRSKIRSSFRERATSLIEPLSFSSATRAPIDSVLPPAAEEITENWSIHTNQDIKNNIDEIGNRIESIKAELNIYTDGSCTGGVRDGVRLQ